MEKLADLPNWCSLIVERLSGGDLLRGVKRFPTWSAAFPATSPSSGEACAGAFYREGAFKFSHTREQMEDEFPARVAGIEGLSQALKLDPAFLKGAHDFQQVLERTAEPIQPPDDNLNSLTNRCFWCRVERMYEIERFSISRHD